MNLDHLILDVNDAARSVAFYVGVLGFTDAGHDGPFRVVRGGDTAILLAPRPTPGGQHLAFAMSRDEFDAVLARIRAAGIAYGDAFDSVGSGRGPGDERGARGMAKSVYLFDPDRHLIEILYYER